MADSSPPGDRGLQEALRAAIERTLAATAGPAAETRGRAQELLDEVARRGTEARESVTRAGTEARESVSRIRPASGDELKALTERIAAVEGRLAALEARGAGAVSRPEVEPE